VDFSGEGIEAFTCSGKSFTKSGQDITFSDASDCLPNHIEVSAVKYCSDSDTMKITVKDDTVPLPISAIARKIDCSAMETTIAPETTMAPETTVTPETTAAHGPETTMAPGPETTAGPGPETTAAPGPETTMAPEDDPEASCTGDADPVIAGETCYQGQAGALGVTETVTVRVKDFSWSNEGGHMDFSGEGVVSFTCTGKAFTKSGQDITFSDSSDCLPDHVEVSAVKYCSDSDTMKITVKDDTVPLPISAIMSLVDCSAIDDAEASCTGDADPVITSETCYQAEIVTVKIKDFANGAGHVDFSGGEGIEAFTCSGKTFTKSGQDITFGDASDCLPNHTEVSAVTYCSDSDTMKISVKDTEIPLPISAIASKVDCPSAIVV
jgi:hypothetical protein